METEKFLQNVQDVMEPCLKRNRIWYFFSLKESHIGVRKNCCTPMIVFLSDASKFLVDKKAPIPLFYNGFGAFLLSEDVACVFSN